MCIIKFGWGFRNGSTVTLYRHKQHSATRTLYRQPTQTPQHKPYVVIWPHVSTKARTGKIHEGKRHQATRCHIPLQVPQTSQKPCDSRFVHIDTEADRWTVPAVYLQLPVAVRFSAVLSPVQSSPAQSSPVQPTSRSQRAEYLIRLP
jgi:hypothetical protein